MSTKIGIIAEGLVDHALLPVLLERIAQDQANYNWPLDPDDVAELFAIRKRGHGSVLETVRKLVSAYQTCRESQLGANHPTEGRRRNTVPSREIQRKRDRPHTDRRDGRCLEDRDLTRTGARSHGCTLIDLGRTLIKLSACVALSARAIRLVARLPWIRDVQC